jgi:hypothetical protein
MNNYNRSWIGKSSGGIYSPRTLQDWLQRNPGGAGVRELRYGYFGPGSGLLQKDITASPPADAFIASDFFTNTFGAKVWDSLNSQTRAFNLIRKVAWGPTTGWRIRTDRNRSTQPVGEVSALPDVDSADLATVFVQPKFIVSAMGVSALAQFLGTLEGGIGDALAVQQEATMIDHTKRLNQLIISKPWSRIIADPGTGQTFTVVNAQGFSVGDTVVVLDGSTGADQTGGTYTVDAVDYNLNTVHVTTSINAAVADNDVLMITVHGGPHSLDTAVGDDDAADANGLVASAGRTRYGSIARNGRESGTAAERYATSNVFANGGVLRHLTTGLLDRAIDESRRNGGEPDLMLTQVEQLTRLGTILQANQHFIGEGTFQVKMGGEGTLVGYPTGFQVATYKGIPLFHDFDLAKSEQQAANGDQERGGHVFVLDTRFIELPVLFTTQYMESRDYLQNNFLGIKAIYLTAFETRILDFRKQSKVVDLTDGVNLT